MKRLVKEHTEALANLPPPRAIQSTSLEQKKVEDLSLNELMTLIEQRKKKSASSQQATAVGEASLSVLETRAKELRQEQELKDNVSREHVQFTSQPNAEVRELLVEVRDRLDGTVCLPECLATEIEQMVKTVDVKKTITTREGFLGRHEVTREHVVGTSNAPYDDDDALPFTKRELMAYIFQQQQRSRALAVSLAKLMEKLNVHDVDVPHAVSLASAQEERESKREKKAAQRKRGCDCGGDCTEHGKAGRICGCYEKSIKCTRLCACVKNGTCNNPINLPPRRPDNVRSEEEDEEMEG